jgi:two-component system response regulator DesR
MKKIRVVVAEDQVMVLGALAALLQIEPDITVCAKATNGREALAAITLHRPDILVTDIEMPEMTGLALAAEVRSQFPLTRVVILTTFARPDI